MEHQRELLKGSTESLLLALLIEQPMYGYQIVKDLERRSQGYFQFREGTLYPALHRLEKDGLVEAKWQPSPNGQQRRYYYITDSGRLELETRLSVWRGFSSAVARVLAPNRA
jgi:PadR family transcriptional regulator PadR